MPRKPWWPTALCTTWFICRLNPKNEHSRLPQLQIYERMVCLSAALFRSAPPNHLSIRSFNSSWNSILMTQPYRCLIGCCWVTVLRAQAITNQRLHICNRSTSFSDAGRIQSAREEEGQKGKQETYFERIDQRLLVNSWAVRCCTPDSFLYRCMSLPTGCTSCL